MCGEEESVNIRDKNRTERAELEPSIFKEQNRTKTQMQEKQKVPELNPNRASPNSELGSGGECKVLLKLLWPK